MIAAVVRVFTSRVLLCSCLITKMRILMSIKRIIELKAIILMIHAELKVCASRARPAIAMWLMLICLTKVSNLSSNNNIELHQSLS